MSETEIPSWKKCPICHKPYTRSEIQQGADGYTDCDFCYENHERMLDKLAVRDKARDALVLAVLGVPIPHDLPFQVWRALDSYKASVDALADAEKVYRAGRASGGD